MSALSGARSLAALGLDDAALAEFCRRRGIRRLSLFGSRLSGRHAATSDVDLLVEFDTDLTPTLLDMADMEQELSVMLGGMPVDLRTPSDLSRYFRDEVLKQAAVQYDAA